MSDAFALPAALALLHVKSGLASGRYSQTGQNTFSAALLAPTAFPTTFARSECPLSGFRTFQSMCRAFVRARKKADQRPHRFEVQVTLCVARVQVALSLRDARFDSRCFGPDSGPN